MHPDSDDSDDAAPQRRVESAWRRVRETHGLVLHRAQSLFRHTIVSEIGEDRHRVLRYVIEKTGRRIASPTRERGRTAASAAREAAALLLLLTYIVERKTRGRTAALARRRLDEEEREAIYAVVTEPRVRALVAGILVREAGEAGDEADEGEECVACLHRERTHVYMPCRHFILCGTCAMQVRAAVERGAPLQCLVCRAPSTLVTRGSLAGKVPSAGELTARRCG